MCDNIFDKIIFFLLYSGIMFDYRLYMMCMQYKYEHFKFNIYILTQ